jgi:hypothetical protein
MHAHNRGRIIITEAYFLAGQRRRARAPWLYIILYGKSLSVPSDAIVCMAVSRVSKFGIRLFAPAAAVSGK